MGCDMDEEKELKASEPFVDLESGCKMANSSTNEIEEIKINGDVKNMNGVKAVVEEKNVNVREGGLSNKPSLKKPPKPPRPPGSPLWDKADLMLVKEISELMRLKQARKKRLRALRRKRLHKEASSSSSLNLYALIFTVLFCIIVIYQGKSPFLCLFGLISNMV